MEYIKSDVFIQIAKDCLYDIDKMAAEIWKINPDMRKYKIATRLSRYRAKGILPLDSGNIVSTGEVLKGTSTMYDSDGNIILQWVKSDTDKSLQLQSIIEAITETARTIKPLDVSTIVPVTDYSDLATIYISNDVHIGAYIAADESAEDYNLTTSVTRLKSAYDYLFQTSPSTRIGIITDLGDLTEADNDKNMTPKSGNILAVDGRYPQILRCAYECIIYAIQKALTKHEVVYFFNVMGNHDINTATSIREIVRMTFINEPRVIVDDTSRPIKYFQHGLTLLQFVHGDAMKPKQAGEVMAVDCESVFSSTRYRYSHFGHVHSDSVIDTPICRVEAHRNLAPNNHWAYGKGYRRGPGTMKSITYSNTSGEISRQIFNL